MRDSLASRVGRLIAGSIHAVMDAVETAAPEVAMEQAVREIDAAIAEVRTDLGHVEAQRHLTGKRLTEESGRHEQLSERAKLALQEGREDLATAAVERQIDIEAQIPVLETRLAELAEEKARLQGYVTALQAKKREMREALADYVAARRQQAAAVPATAGASRGESVHTRAERAGEAFDRIFQRHTGVASSSGSGDVAKLVELEELARRNRIAERIAKLRAGET